MLSTYVLRLPTPTGSNRSPWKLSLALLAFVMLAVPPAAFCHGAVDVSGTWSSDWGPVSINYFGRNPDQSYGVTGYWDQGQGKRGIIERGGYKPSDNGGVLWFDYYEPWKRMRGSAQFKVTQNGTVLDGTYKQDDGAGNWTLTRSSVRYLTAGSASMYHQDASPGRYDGPPSKGGAFAWNTEARKHRRKIDGYWRSDYGPVYFRCGAPSEDGSMPVSGYWDQGAGKRGQITQGKYNPDGSPPTVRFKYYMPWKNVKGHANLKLSDDWQTLSGTWNQPGSKGTWTLTR